MLLNISCAKWTAELLISDAPTLDGLIHLQAKILGCDSTQDALGGAEYILKTYAEGRFAVIRAKPEAMSERDFDTKLMRHQGYVRFSYKLEPGDWLYPDQSMIIGFGELH